MQATKKRKVVTVEHDDKLFGYQLWVGHITRKHLYRKVKFITSSLQLDGYKEKHTVGYTFLRLHEKSCNGGNKLSEEKRFELWMEAKNIVYKVIGEKRCAAQSQLHIKWRSKYLDQFFNFVLYYLHYSTTFSKYRTNISREY